MSEALDFAIWLNDEADAATDPDSERGYRDAARFIETQQAQVRELKEAARRFLNPAFGDYFAARRALAALVPAKRGNSRMTDRPEKPGGSRRSAG